MKKNTKYTVFPVTLALLIATLTLSINTAFALGQVTITVKNPDPYEGNHSWFIYQKQAGDTIEDVAVLKNFSNEVAIVNIYAVDATSSNDGGYILKFKEESQKGIGYWADVETKSVSIGPKESIDIPFKIKLPTNISPGQYLGGLIVEDGAAGGATGNQDESCKDNNICQANIAVQTRIGTRIYLTVPGKTYEDFALTNFTQSKNITGTTKFEFTIENNGNIAYEPKATITVYDSLGNLYEQINKPLGTSSPGTVIHPIVKMKKKPIIGNFKADATVTFDRKFGDSEFHSASPTEKLSLSFWVVPWEIIFTIFIIALIFATYILKQKIAYKKYIFNSKQYIATEEDDLEKIAKNHDIAWKKLAKYNKLKPPYIVKTGDTLMVPKKTK